MGGSGLSREKFNAREQIITSDVMRLQALASRDAQNLLADASTDVAGLPITGLSGPCSLTGIVGQFNMALSAQQALCWNPSDSSLTADDSAYEVARWAAQNLLFANPPGSNARIDLVVVTPAAVDTDSQSRNVLVDPIARTIAPQNVFKTTNPQATVAVVTGTSGASPTPPAVPAGAFPLFEVYVPSGASDSTGFSVVPRMFRRAPFPWSTLSGIVSGFHPVWDLTVTPGVTDSTISFNALEDARVIIDGELIETLGVLLEVFQDGAANPFGSAASATWHRPYYLYAVGGRHAPQRGTVLNAPVIIVESSTPPFVSTGRPTAAITTPRGSAPASACVYIGMGAVCNGTTKRLPCVQDETFLNLTETSILGANVLTHAAASANYEAYDVHAPPVVPVISDAVKVFLDPGSTPTPNVSVAPDRGDGAAAAPGFSGSGINSSISTLTAAGPILISAYGVVPMPNAAAPKFWVATAAGAGTTAMCILGYNHKVARLRW